MMTAANRKQRVTDLPGRQPPRADVEGDRFASLTANVRFRRKTQDRNRSIAVVEKDDSVGST